MSDREDFEKWAKDGFQLGKGCDGYLSAFTSSAFRAWQARQPEIDALIHDNASLYKNLNSESSERCRLEEENTALKAENERLRKAAERVIRCWRRENWTDGMPDLSTCLKWLNDALEEMK